jgi:fused signal recognition particle receptor
MLELENGCAPPQKVIPGAPDIPLVMDATTGQTASPSPRVHLCRRRNRNYLDQLDGTASGATSAGICANPACPSAFGTGEQINDLVPFDAQTYADSLFN